MLLDIPISWLHDGFVDCENRMDELDDWEKCGSSNVIYNSIRYNYKNKTCENVLLCNKIEYIELEDLCTRNNKCGIENPICIIFNRNTGLYSTKILSENMLLKRIAYCLPGLEDPLFPRCDEITLVIQNTTFFGIENLTIVLPQAILECEYMFGENYVYSSCSGKCGHIPCPVTESNIPIYRSCLRQYANRIGTLANNRYLTFGLKAGYNVYRNSTSNSNWKIGISSRYFK